MLKKVLFGFSLVLHFISFANGQSSNDYHKNEVSAGYSHQFFHVPSRDDLIGFDVSVVHNLSRFFGVKGDFSAGFRRRTATFAINNGTGIVTSPQFEVNNSLYNLLGGIQIKDNRNEGSRFRPFAHALVGFAAFRSKSDLSALSSTFCAQNNIVCSNTRSTSSGIAAAFGGGLDIRASKRISIRAIQVDYNPTHTNGYTQNNIRVGVGLVFH